MSNRASSFEDGADWRTASPTKSKAATRRRLLAICPRSTTSAQISYLRLTHRASTKPQHTSSASVATTVNADPHNTKDWTATDYFWFDTTSIDPATNLPAYCIGAAYGTNSQISPASAALCKHSGPGTGLQHSDSKTWVQVVPSPVQDSCSPIDMYKLPEGEEC